MLREYNAADLLTLAVQFENMAKKCLAKAEPIHQGDKPGQWLISLN
jgi:hypothetical protein